MENENTPIVQAALAGDPVETQRLFNDRMNNMVADRVDTMRKEIAQTILAPQEPTTDASDHE